MTDRKNDAITNVTGKMLGDNFDTSRPEPKRAAPAGKATSSGDLPSDAVLNKVLTPYEIALVKTPENKIYTDKEREARRQALVKVRSFQANMPHEPRKPVPTQTNPALAGRRTTIVHPNGDGSRTVVGPDIWSKPLPEGPVDLTEAHMDRIANEVSRAMCEALDRASITLLSAQFPEIRAFMREQIVKARYTSGKGSDMRHHEINVVPN